LDIKKIVENGEFGEVHKSGRVRTYDKIIEDYERFVLPKIDIKRKMKVVIDPANSVGSIVAPRMFENAGCEVVMINDKLDGVSPSRPWEPKAENIQALKDRVVKENADIGMAFDGDCDRVLFVDNEGKVIDSSSLIIMFFAEHYLKENKGACVTFDLGCSMAVEEMIKENGGVPVETKVGTSYIKADMKKNGSIIGGESSNHLYFSDVYNFDDAIFAGLKMAEIISKLQIPLSEKIKSFPSYYYLPESEFECADSKKEAVLQRIKDKFKTSGLRFSELDGFKLYYDDGWVLWRPSGTSPCMRIYIESKKKERLEELREFAKAELVKAMG
jgi:phosphomannomutase/phosphoglucomutase